MKNTLYYSDNLDILRRYIKGGVPCNLVYIICTARLKSFERFQRFG